MRGRSSALGTERNKRRRASVRRNTDACGRHALSTCVSEELDVLVQIQETGGLWKSVLLGAILYSRKKESVSRKIFLLRRILIRLICSLSVSASLSSSYGERGSDLGLQVFLRVVQDKPLENVVMSPHGVASILGMLLPGAHGDTRRQLLTGLKYKKSGPYKMLRKLHKALTTKSNADIVTIANALFPNEGFSLKEDFLTANRENFLCETQTIDYSNPEKAAETINEWVKNSTKGHIPSLVNADMFDSALTRLVAVNSIYFKGLWKSRFQAQNTKPRSFTAGDGKTYKVPMMSQLSVFNMGQASTPADLKYTVIELPYHGNSMSMFIALPSNEDTPLSAILPHISTATVQSWTKQLNQRRMRFLMPKFTAEQEVDLEAPLKAMGIKDIFSQNKADFRHLSSEFVYVSKALQKAKIEVNEDGTKASAATKGIKGKTAMAAEIHSRPQSSRPVLLNKIEGHSDSVNTAVLIPKEDGVITVSEDRTIRVWLKRDSGQYWPSIYHTVSSPCSCMSYHHESRRIFIGQDNGTVVWVISTGHDKSVSWMSSQSGSMLGRHSFGSWASCLQYDNDTQHTFVGDYSGQITLLKLDEQSCSVITTLKGHEGSVAALYWDPVQRWLFSGASDHSVIIEKVQALRYLPLTHQLVSCSADGGITVWNMETTREEAPQWLESDSCQKCEQPFFWNIKQMWDTKTLGLRQHHCRKCGKAICGKCSSKRSTYPIMGFEFQVRMCDDCYDTIKEEDRTPLATFHEGKHNIAHMDMDPSRGLMVTCGSDRVVKIWDMTQVVGSSVAAGFSPR
ncbi:WD repeat and FYVE domain-containing protein 1 [Anabarilius grahami]|uniref:WD repeat and FYVE domain-containing protein 1 n=1 Tax=Anabarilius grahami TaxID=495550 RepID=A0A3N0XQX8_ANAGA|nr:WD repeat and FYVE domain-containing protein 1 [Anabarilius grahami]